MQLETLECRNYTWLRTRAVLRVEGRHELGVGQPVLRLEVHAIVEDGAVPLEVVEVRGRVGDVGHAAHDPLLSAACVCVCVVVTVGGQAGAWW